MTRAERKRYREWQRLWQAVDELRILAKKYKSLGIFSQGFASIEESLKFFTWEEARKFKEAKRREVKK